MSEFKHIGLDNFPNLSHAFEEMYKRCADFDLKKLHNSRILISGGTGFFGTWMIGFLYYLYKNKNFKFEIFCITRNYKNIKHLCDFIGNDMPFNVLVGDMRHIDLADVRPDLLIHFANVSATETFHGIDQFEKVDALYMGTKNILDQCGKTLKSVLFSSSGVVYGPDPVDGSHFFEEQLLQSRSDKNSFSLGIGKIVTELMISEYSRRYNYSYSIARCFSFAGELMPLDLHYAFGNFIRCAKSQTDIILNSDGSAVRSYLYIGDAIVWLSCLLCEPKNTIVNVGSDEPISILELAKLIANKSGVAVKSSPDLKVEGNFVRPTYLPSLGKLFDLYPHLQVWTSVDQLVDCMLVQPKSRNIEF